MIKQSILLALSGAALSCSAQQGAQTPETAVTEQTGSGPNIGPVDRARRMIARGELDAGLALTDDILKSDPNNREARKVAAAGNFALFQSGRDGSQWFLQDAINNLELALDQNAQDPEALEMLARCQLLISEFDSGFENAMQAAQLYQAQGAEKGKVADMLLLAADNQMQVFVDARRVEVASEIDRPSDDTVELANAVLRTLKTAKMTAKPSAALVKEAAVYQWVNQEERARQALEDGVRADASDTTIHDGLQQFYFDRGWQQDCVTVYERLLKEQPSSTATLWYLGRAQVALADKQRKDASFEAALGSYREALATYEKYDRMRPDHHDGTAQWLAICNLSIGRIQLDSGDLDAAKRSFWAAYDATPLVAEYRADGYPRVYDSFGGNYLGGLSLIGQRISDGSGVDSLRDSLQFFEEVLAKHPDRFGAFYNNAALSARDLGVAVWNDAKRAAEASASTAEQQAGSSEAMQLWEKSYRYYCKAVELSPEDARIVNDCGLMLVYHLNREYDRAEQLFRRAAELGQEKLDRLPGDAPIAEVNDVEEAVGDAWQNLGKMYLDNLHEPQEALPFLKKALNYYPYQERNARRMIRHIEAGGQQDPQDAARQARFNTVAAKARPLAADGDFEGALGQLDPVAVELREHAPFKAMYGTYTLRFAEDRAANGGDAAFVAGLFEDATRHLRAAVTLDGEPLEPRLELCKALVATGRNAEAAKEADDLLSHTRSVGGAPDAFLAEAHALRARAAARAYIEKKSATPSENDESLLQMARTSFDQIEGNGALSEADAQLWITTEQWADAAGRALAIRIRAFQKDPNQIGPMVELAAQLGASAPVVKQLEGVEDPTQLWWRGRAGFDLGTQLWSRGEAEKGIEALNSAIADFEASKQANAGFAESCDVWIALCKGQRGYLQLANDDLAGAKDSFLDALSSRPDVAESDLGSGSTIRRGVLLVADRYYQQRDLATTCEVYAVAGEALPEDVQIANNHGLMARDYGNQLERREGDAEAAMRYYEASYAAYTRAQQNSPEDVRLSNDRALILVYHLKRELDTARELLENSIEMGNRQLKENPPEDPDELQNLSEAVGDAYENLGLFHIEFSKDYAKAREVLEKSFDYHPGRRRPGSRQHLSRLDQLEKDKDG